MAVRSAARRAALVAAILVLILSRPLTATLTFAPPTFAETGIGPSAIAVADFNGDGHPDFATGNLDSTVTVRFGDGAGAFPTSASYTGFSSPAVIVAGDLNKDGHPDLIVSNSPSFGDATITNTLAILINDGAGVFTALPRITLTGTASGIAIGDFNQDGNEDVLAAQANGLDALSFLPGDGAGGFGAATHPSLPPGHTAIKLTAADFNGDGHLDAAIAAGATVDWIFGNGDGTFSAATVFTFPSPQGEGGAVAITSADIDHDGDIDVATSGGNVLAGASVFRNNGSGVFSWTQFSMPQAPANPVELALADLDGDGNLDIVTANMNGCPPWGSNLSARPGNGDGTFGAAVAISVGYTNCVNAWYNPVAVAAVDLNCDGKADLLAPLQNSTVSFHNVAVILSPGGGSDTTPPVVTPPADITLDAGAACLRHLSDTDIGTATATDNCSCVTVSRGAVPAGNDFPVGTTTITWTASDCHGNTSTATQKVTVVDSTPPALTAPANVSVTAGASCVASLDPGTATASDMCGVPAVQGVRSDGQPLLAPYPVGTTTITWTATDGGGNSTSAPQTVTVAAPPPVISGVQATPPVLWPPNHKLVNVTVDYTVTGGCGAVTCVVDSITSSEPDNGLGDGDTASDWQIVDAHHVRLRAERAGGGPGRVYTIHITCTDGYGHATSSSVTVTVPHNR
jgi:hypothetical protein